jgi:DNA-binding NarL/FixJ family response regulator
MKPLRILLVDDHILFRKGVAALLSFRPELQVVGEAGDGLEAVAMARELLPDVVLMDIAMPGCGGLEAVRRISRELPRVRVVMLTISDDDSDLFEAIKNGAAGYLLKDLEPAQLYDMLEGVRRGEAPITGALAARILEELRTPGAKSTSRPAERETITPREREVLERLVAGDTNQEIARALCLTENTVKLHLKNILSKLHVRNRVQAALMAVREGLVDDPLASS